MSRGNLLRDCFRVQEVCLVLHLVRNVSTAAPLSGGLVSVKIGVDHRSQGPDGEVTVPQGSGTNLNVDLQWSYTTGASTGETWLPVFGATHTWPYMDTVGP
jgi:hypothetical protein